MNAHITKQFVCQLLSSFHWKSFPNSPQAQGRLLIKPQRFLKDRASKLGNVVSSLILWNECTRQTALSWNGSFWVLFQDISLFTIVFNTSQNITFSLSEEPCSNTALWWSGITPSVECTHHKALPQKASLQFSSEVVSLLTTSPGTPLNNTAKIRQTQSF